MKKTGEILWLVFQYAKQDRQSFIDAYRGDTPNEFVRGAIADIKAIEKLQLKLFGTTKSELEAKISKMKPVDILDLIAKNQNIEEL